MEDAPILICFDGSDEAVHAIEAAATLLGPRRAVVLAVGRPLTPAESMALVTSPVPGTAFEDLNTAAATERAGAGVDRARAAGLDATARAELGTSWQVIVQVADELDAPVIVVGSHGRDGAHELFEGSVSRAVIDHAHRPVLVVPR